MKKYFLLSVLLIAIALLLTILVWAWLQGLLKDNVEEVTPVPTLVAEVGGNNSVGAVSEADLAVTPIISQEPEGNTPVAAPMALRDLPLSKEQKEAAANIGIDVDTFVVTPSMIDCVEGKFGTKRMEDIIGGETPTFFETLSLITCLGSN